MRTLTLLIIFLSYYASQGQNFVLVFLNKKQGGVELPKADVDTLMKKHMANINRLAKEGKLVAAGPFEGGGGIFIFKAASPQEVDEWLSTDPAVRANRWNIERFAYQPTVGSVCAVSEPYEMTNYWFVRFSVNVTKYSIGDVSEQLAKHRAYVKKNSAALGVFAGGYLGEEGEIAILKESPSSEILSKDPAVQSGAMEYEIKKLFIARGSFCEPR